MSVRRSAASFGLAAVLGHTSQFVWLVAAVRIMPAADFGTVLAAQALYGVLQIVVDIGTNAVGARMAARDELDDDRRGQILRMRLILALTVAPVAVVSGALEVSGSLVATAPFVVALGLYAVLNVWEPYGSGDARPWATYMFARSGVLALVACVFLGAGVRFPVELAGGVECVAIIVVMVVFGRARLSSVRLALRARGGPWRAVFSIGAPAFAAQISMASGTLVLSGSGNPVAAGVFAACVRLLSGVNAINGVLAASLYPRLARGIGERSEGDRQVVTHALGLIALLSTSATAVSVLFGQPIATAFIGTTSRSEIAALALTMAAAVPLGNVVMFSYQMLARGHEGATLLPFALGGSLTTGLSVLAVAAAGARVSVVAAALLAGQLVTMVGLGLRLRTRCPGISAEAGRSMTLAAVVGLLACASLLPAGRLPSGLLLIVLAAALLPRLRPLVTSLRRDLAHRNRRAPATADPKDGP